MFFLFGESSYIYDRRKKAVSVVHQGTSSHFFLLKNWNLKIEIILFGQVKTDYGQKQFSWTNINGAFQMKFYIVPTLQISEMYV
jgi:hypothetical protein